VSWILVAHKGSCTQHTRYASLAENDTRLTTPQQRVLLLPLLLLLLPVLLDE
jgi:hypothetical protein